MQEAYVQFTAVLGGATLLLPAAEVELDSIGNVSFRWTDAVHQGRLFRESDLLGWLSRNVDQQRNRVAAQVAITDPGGVLLDVEWVEFDPWAGAVSGPHLVRGVAVLASAGSTATEGRVAVVVSRAGSRIERGTGLVEP